MNDLDAFMDSISGDGLYNTARAQQLGYTKDESGHLPSVDHKTGDWLKSKKHPTAFMELYEYATNPHIQKKLNHPVVNIDGHFGEDQLTYPKRYADGGPVKPPKNEPIYVTDPKDPRLVAYNDSLSLYKDSQKNIDYFRKLEGDKLHYQIDKPTMVRGDNKFADIKLYPHNKINPEGYFTDERFGVGLTPAFKKPVQPVLLEKNTPIPTKQPSLEPLQLQDQQLQPREFPTAITYPKAVNNYSAAGYPMVGGKVVPEGRVHERGTWKEFSTGGKVSLDGYMDSLLKK